MISKSISALIYIKIQLIDKLYESVFEHYL